MSETIISSAPAAFNSEYRGDELGSFSNCRSRYATMIKTTPMNPAKSNNWKFMVIATAIARRSESRVPAAHYNLRHWFDYTASEHVFACLRHLTRVRTEVFGVKALAAHLSERFGIPWEFIDCPTGL